MDVRDIATEMTKDKFPELVEKLFGKGADYGVEVGTRAQKAMINAERNAIAAARGASLYDMEADTGLAVSRILLSVYPEDFNPSKKSKKKTDGSDAVDDDGEPDGPTKGEFVGPLTEEQLAQRTALDEARKARVAILIKKLEAWKRIKAEEEAKAERDAAIRDAEKAKTQCEPTEKSDDELDEDDELEMQALIVPPDLIADSGVNLAKVRLFSSSHKHANAGALKTAFRSVPL